MVLVGILLVCMIFNTSAHADKNCDEIKGNIVGKLFCNATSDSESNSTSEVGQKKKGVLSKIWTRPEWTKRKKTN